MDMNFSAAFTDALKARVREALPEVRKGLEEAVNTLEGVVELVDESVEKAHKKAVEVLDLVGAFVAEEGNAWTKATKPKATEKTEEEEKEYLKGLIRKYYGGTVFGTDSYLARLGLTELRTIADSINL